MNSQRITGEFELTTLFREVSPYQVKLLFKQLAQASIASVIAAIYITIVLWSVVSHFWLVVWSGFIFLTSVCRIVLVRNYKKLSPENDQLESWLDAATLLIVIASISWGSLAFIYDVNCPVFYQFAVISVLFIVALGAMPVYATILPLYIISLTLVLLPMAVVFFLSTTDNFLLYGTGLVVLWILLFSLSKRYHDYVILEVGKNQNYREGYQDLKSSNDDLSLALEEKENEEEKARAVYTRIAKLQPIDKYGIKGMVEPMGHFSGDFIFYALTPDGQTYILFADFTGHGLPAALGAIPVSSIFYSMTAKGIRPEEIIKELNVNLHAQLSTDQFCCACFIALNPERTSAKVWNGGIPDLLIVKDHNQSFNRISSTNIPLGIQLTNTYEGTFETISLSKGDVVFAYTDGVIEAWDETDEVFGNERLEEHLIKNYREPDLLNIIKAEIDKHSKGRMQEDDISMLEIRC